MNNFQSEPKSTTAKLVTILGFFVIVIFGIWLAVKAVQIIPSAFSSLASIAESLDEGAPKTSITTSTEKSIVNAGESFTINWSDINREGSYGFSYQCIDGVSVDVRTQDGEVRTLTCGNIITLTDETTELDVMIESEKSRFADIAYNVSFTRLGDTEQFTSISDEITVVNATIPQDGFVATTQGIDRETETEEPVTQMPEEETETPVRSTPLPPVPATKTITETYTYFPVSNPDGFSDLQLTFIATGIFSGNSFIPTNEIDNDRQGALQFEVRNIGTRTSGSWTFDLELPNGDDLDSETQDGLKPNERSIITIGFDTGNDTGREDFSIEIDTNRDVNTRNNDFDGSVRIVN